ncbi:MAG: trigger factor [Chromatiales bacterium]|nr:trigger factor [Chromatiales bacterium]
MQVSVEETGALERRMTLQVPTDGLESRMESRLKELSREVRMDGFRPGKVPLRVIKQRFGHQIRRELVGELMQQSFDKAVTDGQLQLASRPLIEPLNDLDGDQVEFTAVFEVLPKIELADLSSAVVKRPVAEVTEADVDKLIENLRKQRIEWNEADRPSVEGDRVVVDFVGRMDGETFEGGSAQGVGIVIGEGKMIDGFEQGITGLKSGESTTVAVTFPEGYPAEQLAGKPAEFEVTVQSVSAPKLPEVDEEFARGFGVESGSVEQFRQDVRANMERELRQALKTQTRTRVMDVLLEQHAFDVPKALVEDESKRLMEQTNMRAGGGKSELNLPKELFEGQAKRRVSLGLLLAELVREHELKPDPDRVRANVEELAAAYDEPDEVVKWYYQNPEQISNMEAVVMEEQVVDWVLGRVKVEDEPTDFDSMVRPESA